MVRRRAVSKKVKMKAKTKISRTKKAVKKMRATTAKKVRAAKAASAIAKAGPTSELKIKNAARGTANLLITYDPAHAGKAENEVKALLAQTGEQAQFEKSDVDGVFLLKVSNAKAVVKKLCAACKNRPDDFAYTFKWAPIERWMRTDMDQLLDAMKEFDKQMAPSKSWKLELAKRRFDKHDTMALIVKLTEPINKPNVDLKNPEQIIKVEIMGERTGIALLNRDEYLDVAKIKARQVQVA